MSIMFDIQFKYRTVDQISILPPVVNFISNSLEFRILVGSFVAAFKQVASTSKLGAQTQMRDIHLFLDE